MKRKRKQKMKQALASILIFSMLIGNTSIAQASSTDYVTVESVLENEQEGEILSEEIVSEPTIESADEPTDEPIIEPTGEPTVEPTNTPEVTSMPTETPAQETIKPTELPSIKSEEVKPTEESTKESAEVNEIELKEESTTEMVAVENYTELQETVAQLQDEISQDDDTIGKFSTKTLLLKVKEGSELDPLNATTIIQGVDDLMILVFDTELNAKKAYKKYKDMDNIVSVEIDAVSEIKTLDSNNDAVALAAEELEDTRSAIKKFLDEQSQEEEVVVALIDTGVDLSHKVIKDRLVSEGINLSTSGKDGNADDDNGHGTKLAELIIANTGNKVKILPIKNANADGYATVLNTYLAIKTAIEQEVDVINLSAITINSNTTYILEDAINEATEKGIVVVVSAGNFKSDIKHYSPASVESAITVSATDETGKFAKYSNYGELVDYAANGVYGEKRGTSYSTAFITSLVATLKSTNKSLTTNEVEKILSKYAVDLGDEGQDKYYGKGYLSLETLETSEEEIKEELAKIKEEIFDIYNWKELSDEKLAKCINEANEYYLALFVQKLSQEDLEYLLTKDSILNAEYVTYGYEKDLQGNYVVANQTVDETGEVFTEYKVYKESVVKYIDYLLAIELSGVTSQTYVTLNGSYTLNINDESKSNSSYVIRTRVSDDDNTKQQVATFSIISQTNNHDFQITRASRNTEKGADNTGKKIYQDGTTGYDEDGNKIYRSIYYNVFIVTGTYEKSAYTYATPSFEKVCDCCRMNFEEYNWQASGQYTLNNKRLNHKTVTEEITMSVGAHQTGNVIMENGSTGNAKMTINLQHPVLNVTYSANGGSDNGKIATYSQVVKYDGISKVTTRTSNYFGLTKLGHHVTPNEEWKTGTNSSDPLFGASLSLYAHVLNPFSDGSSMTSSNVKLYANWTPNTYTIEYNSNTYDGGNGPSEFQYATYGKNVSIISQPSTQWKTGYHFAGWLDKRDNTIYQPNVKVKNLTSDYNGYVTLYAIWVPNTYTIEYNANVSAGGNGASAYGYETYDQTVTFIDNPGQWKTGYRFAGWHCPLNGKQYQPYDKDINLTSDYNGYVTLYAIWIPITYWVSYNGNGGIIGNDPTQVMASTFHIYNEYQALRKNVYWRVGYQFDGWIDNETNAPNVTYYGDEQSVVNLNDTQDGVRNLYVSWKANTYYVKYWPDGGLLPDGTYGFMDDSIHTYDQSSALSANQYVREGYVFAGWRDIETTGVEQIYADQALVKNLHGTQDGVRNIGALWEPGVYEITLDHQGGSNSDHFMYEKYSVGFYEDITAKNIKTSIKLPSRVHYKFLGYYTGKDGTGTKVIDENGTIVGSNTLFTSDSTVYAYWEPVYYITYDANTDKACVVPEKQVKEKDKAINLTLNDATVTVQYYDTLYRFQGWNDKADGSGNWYAAPYAYTKNEDLTLYAQWATTLNVAYIGNEQLEGQDFTDEEIADDEVYTFSDNTESDGSDHYVKSVEKSYMDEETGIEVVEEVSATIVGWSFDKNVKANEINKLYDENETIETVELYKNARDDGNALSVGRPNSDYGTYPKNLVTRSNVTPLNGKSTHGLSSYASFSLLSNYISLANTQSTKSVEQMPYVNMYAVWDEGAIIEAYDLYFDLEFAQSTTGSTGITKELLLSYARATDEEDGELSTGENVSIGNGKTTTFTLTDYASTDFTSFTADGSVTINYQAIDSVGNITNKMVTVHIVDNRPSDGLEITYTRFISEKYYEQTPEDGGLAENSIWRTNPDYRKVLEDSFANLRNDTPVQTYSFTHAKIEEIKEYVRTHGIGNSRSSDALSNFYAQFMS